MLDYIPIHSLQIPLSSVSDDSPASSLASLSRVTFVISSWFCDELCYGRSLPRTFGTFGLQVEGLLASVVTVCDNDTPVSSDYAMCGSLSSYFDAE